jgi:hypothetical protein
MANTSYEKLTVTPSSALGLASLPKSSTYAFFSVEDDDIRVRIDGTAPTASEGIFFGAGDSFEVCGLAALSNFKTIATDTGNASLKINYGEDGSRNKIGIFNRVS